MAEILKYREVVISDQISDDFKEIKFSTGKSNCSTNCLFSNQHIFQVEFTVLYKISKFQKKREVIATKMMTLLETDSSIGEPQTIF